MNKGQGNASNSTVSRFCSYSVLSLSDIHLACNKTLFLLFHAAKKASSETPEQLLFRQDQNISPVSTLLFKAASNSTTSFKKKTIPKLEWWFLWVLSSKGTLLGWGLGFLQNYFSLFVIFLSAKWQILGSNGLSVRYNFASKMSFLVSLPRVNFIRIFGNTAWLCSSWKGIVKFWKGFQDSANKN